MDYTKPHVQVFMLFPEPEPSQFYIKNDIGYQTEEYLAKYLLRISSCKNLIEIENYQGLYDGDNVRQFIEHYKVLEDYYPARPSSLLRSQLKSWRNWREDRHSGREYESKLYGNTLTNETFCEVAVRREIEYTNNHVIVSHQGLNIPVGTTHLVEFLEKAYPIPCIELSELPLWFTINRLPQRNYHPSPKHGENGRGEWSGAAKLLCSHVKAQDLLAQAFGVWELDELYLYDENHDKYITFRFEGDNTLNQYHAYHIEDNDVPKSIKTLHSKLHELTRND